MSITGVEQILEIVLDTGNDRSVYFYTRITDAVNAELAQCLDYIRDFHVNAMGKAEGDRVSHGRYIHHSGISAKYIDRRHPDP